MVVQAILDIFCVLITKIVFIFHQSEIRLGHSGGQILAFLTKIVIFEKKGSNLNPRVAKWDSTLAKIEHDFRNQHTKNV